MSPNDRPDSVQPREGALHSRFWRGLALALVAGLFYIGHGLASLAQAQSGRGASPVVSGGGQQWWENAAFADGGQLVHLAGGRVDVIVTTIDEGNSLLVWIFGPVVNGVPELKQVVRFTR